MKRQIPSNFHWQIVETNEFKTGTIKLELKLVFWKLHDSLQNGTTLFLDQKLEMSLIFYFLTKSMHQEKTKRVGSIYALLWTFFYSLATSPRPPKRYGWKMMQCIFQQKCLNWIEDGTNFLLMLRAAVSGVVAQHGTKW